MIIQAPKADLKEHKDCAKAQTVLQVMLPESGYQIDPRAILLFIQSAMVPQPLTIGETEIIAQELRKGSAYLQQLQQLPDGWDRGKVTKLIGWAQQLFEKPLAENRGFISQCMNPITSPRHDPGLETSEISEGDVKKMLSSFSINTKDLDPAAYLKGPVLAGQRREGARKLVLIYLDQHMSMPLQRRLISVYFNMYQEGARSVVFEGMATSGTDMLKVGGYDEMVARVQKEIDRSDLPSILALFEREAQHAKQLIEDGAARQANEVYYPAMARTAILSAMTLPDGQLLGVDDPRIIKDMNFVCWSDDETLHPIEKELFTEACGNYVMEFRSHLAIRKLKKLTEPNDKQEVIFMPFGMGHLTSLIGELKGDDYKDYSFVVVAPPEVLQKPSFEDRMWVNEMIMKAKAKSD